MASYSFDIDRHQFERAFKVIRCRFDIIEIWMELTKLIINYYPPDGNSIYASIDIFTAKMNRAFIKNEERIFSISFPFRIEAEDGLYRLRSVHGIEIDSQITSEVLLAISAFKSGSIKNEWDLIQYFEDQDGVSENFWTLLTELLDAEDGYLRFDHDPAQRNGHRHPLDHADIFYTNASTFKVGLRNRPNLEKIVDILNRETDCHYLELP